jgi:hypothetical protein
VSVYILIQDQVCTVAFCVPVIVDEEEMQFVFLQPLLVPGTKVVTIDNHEASVQRDCQIGRQSCVLFTAGLGSDAIDCKTVSVQPTLNIRHLSGYGKDRASPRIPPGLGQGETAHDMASPHLLAGIRPNEQR